MEFILGLVVLLGMWGYEKFDCWRFRNSQEYRDLMEQMRRKN